MRHAKLVEDSRLPEKKRPFCSAVIVAAGSGERMGGINKIFTPVCGVPVLAHTLSVFERSDDIDEIVIVVREGETSAAAELLKQFSFSKVKTIVHGGARRQDSVYAGLMAISRSAQLAAVHDAARPLVTQQVISQAVAGAVSFGAAAPAIPVKDTLKIAENGVAVSTPDRSCYFAVQTPQIFDADVLKAALSDALRSGAELTDDCMAVERLGMKVKLTSGSEENIKLTTPTDLLFAEAILNGRKTTTN